MSCIGKETLFSMEDCFGGGAVDLFAESNIMGLLQKTSFTK